MNNRGTPKHLVRAIENGISAAKEILSERSLALTDEEKDSIVCMIVYTHVEDFLRQKLGVLMLSSVEAEVESAIKFQRLLKIDPAEAA